jgi:hypothetical protein
MDPPPFLWSLPVCSPNMRADSCFPAIAAFDCVLMFFARIMIKKS